MAPVALALLATDNTVPLSRGPGVTLEGASGLFALSLLQSLCFLFPKLEAPQLNVLVPMEGEQMPGNTAKVSIT